MLTDVELLSIELETIWVSDVRGRLVRSREANSSPAPHLVLACAGDDAIVAIGHEVPDTPARELESVVVKHRSADTDELLRDCANILEPVFGPLKTSSGPSYLVPAGLTFASGARILHSGAGKAEAGTFPVPDGWTSAEWRTLLEGSLGPWAAAIDGDNIIALCHSARLGERGAEAGVWTHPAHRGRGHAAGVTAAWASMFPVGSRQLFYSTDRDNRSSRRVAARLGLREIGWMWRLASPGEQPMLPRPRRRPAQTY